MVGGTGRQGFGIALRLAKAGHHLTIGSRSRERALEAAAAIGEASGGKIDGGLNEEAVANADVVFVTVPHPAQKEIYEAIGSLLGSRAIVVDTTNPIASEAKASPGEIRSAQQESAAEEAAKLLPAGVRLVAGFQTVSASKLRDLEHPLKGDVLLCGDDDEAKQRVGELVEDMPDLRWVDAGGLSMARAVERLTGLLISVNKRYGIKGASVHLHGHPRFGRP